MPSTIDPQIQNRIAEFVQELDVLVRKSALEALKSVLANGAVPARRGRPAGVRRGPGRPSAAAGGDSSAAVVAFVRANDGQGVREIAAGTGLAPKLAKKVVTQLLQSGALKKSGQRRGTVYHVGSGTPPRAAKAKRAKRGKKRGRRAKAA